LLHRAFGKRGVWYHTETEIKIQTRLQLLSESLHSLILNFVPTNFSQSNLHH
jgi:hypothetical protein